MKFEQETEEEGFETLVQKMLSLSLKKAREFLKENILKFK